MPIKIPPIYEFPKDGGLWRIDWLGAVHRTSAEALIDVFLSPAKSGIRNPSRQSDFDSDQVELVKIGIGQIPFLTIGSLWRDRCRVGHVIATMTTFRSVKINADTVRLVNAGAVRTEKPKRYFQIPPFKHAIQKDAWSSQCLAIEHNGDKYGILLPVSEAIRFYYAVSTDMAQVVFDGLLRFNRNSVINEAMSGMLQYSQRMVLQLRQWLADDDGWIIARMLLDSNAESGATQAFNSMMRDSIKGQLVFPECGLPFEGTTRWHARCIELQMNNERPRWLIQELMSCSALFPVEELEIIRDNDGRQAQNPYDDLPDEEKKPA